MFHIFRGLCKGLFPNFIHRMNFSLMKQSVAPESTSAFVSAIALLVLIETGICMDRNHVVTIMELNLWTALTQADGFRRSENPLSQRGLSSPVLAHLLLPWPLLEAMSRLVVGEFGCLTALSSVVLHRIHFYRRPPLHVLDLDVGSSCVGCYCLICSTYVGGSCDSDVPSCDTYNTQLHVGLSSFLLRVLFSCILLGVHTLLEAWLQGSSLHFLQHDLWFFRPMYPWRSDQPTFVVASILLGVRWLSLHDVLLVSPSYGCNPVGG